MGCELRDIGGNRVVRYIGVCTCVCVCVHACVGRYMSLGMSIFN